MTEHLPGFDAVLCCYCCFWCWSISGQCQSRTNHRKYQKERYIHLSDNYISPPPPVNQGVEHRTNEDSQSANQPVSRLASQSAKHNDRLVHHYQQQQLVTLNVVYLLANHVRIVAAGSIVAPRKPADYCQQAAISLQGDK